MELGARAAEGKDVRDLRRTEPHDRLDRLTPAQLNTWWTRRLRRLVRTAYEELAFYRSRFDEAGFHPDAFRRLEDLRLVPPFTKADVLAEQRRSGWHAVGMERLPGGAPSILTLSSGTKGTTVLTWPARWRRVQGESSLRAHRWAGLRPGTTLMLTAPSWHVYAAVQTYIVERMDLSCAVVAGTFLPRFAGRIVDTMLSFRPQFISMFLPMVFSLVSEARRRGLPPREVFGSVETLVVTGAPITPGMRAHVEHETGVARVLELAGASENLLAVECGVRAGLHVVPDTCHLEVVDRATGRPAEPGARGDVVLTTVVPWGSIYLRYVTGDAGVLDPSPCPCGLPAPRVKMVGRWEDGFRLGGQDLLPYDVQLALEEEVPELAGTQCIILRDGLVAGRLRLALPRRGEGPPDGHHADAEGAVVRALQRRFGVPVELRWVGDLPLQFKGVPTVLSEQDLQ